MGAADRRGGAGCRLFGPTSSRRAQALGRGGRSRPGGRGPLPDAAAAFAHGPLHAHRQSRARLRGRGARPRRRRGGRRSLRADARTHGACRPALIRDGPDRRARGDGGREIPFRCAPLIFGYANYAADGFRARRIRFADIPALGSHGPVGSALGGTGIAVSAFGARKKAAADFAWWVASAEVQAGLYASSGGQPAHAAAWDSDAVNAPVAEARGGPRAWLRPRHDGYMPFQDAAARLLNEALLAASPARETIARINAVSREVSRRQAPAIKASDSSKLA